MSKVSAILKFLEANTVVNSASLFTNYRLYDETTFRMKFSVNKYDYIYGIVYYLMTNKKLFIESSSKTNIIAQFMVKELRIHPVFVNGILNRLFQLSISRSLSTVIVKNIDFYSELIERCARSGDASTLQKFYFKIRKDKTFLSFKRKLEEV